MKKIIPLILVISILICGCNETATFKNNNNKNHEYIIFNGLDWGMSEQECTEILKLDENDKTPLASSYEDDIFTKYGFSYDTKVYGYKAKVFLFFASNLGDLKKDIGLIKIGMTFEHENYDIKKLYNKWDKSIRYSNHEEEIKKRNPKKIKPSKTLMDTRFSPTTIKTLKDENEKEKTINLLKQINADDVPSLEINRLLKIPLSNTHFEYFSYQKVNITHDGFTAALLNHAIKE